MTKHATKQRNLALYWRALLLMRRADWLTSCAVQIDATVHTNWTDHGGLKVSLLKHYAQWFGLDLDEEAALAFHAVCSGERATPWELVVLNGWLRISEFWRTTMDELGVRDSADVLGIVAVACRWAPNRPEMRVAI